MKTTKRNNKGQAISEYLILTAIIAVGSIAVVQTLGYNVHSRLAKIAAALGGGARKDIDAATIRKKDHYEMRDLDDFDAGIGNEK